MSGVGNASADDNRHISDGIGRRLRRDRGQGFDTVRVPKKPGRLRTHSTQAASIAAIAPPPQAFACVRTCPTILSAAIPRTESSRSVVVIPGPLQPGGPNARWGEPVVGAVMR